jgi:hypothetical protein
MRDTIHHQTKKGNRLAPRWLHPMDERQPWTVQQMKCQMNKKTVLKLVIDVTYTRELTPDQLKVAVERLKDAADFLAGEGLLTSDHRETPLQNWDAQVFELKTKRPWLASS